MRSFGLTFPLIQKIFSFTGNIGLNILHRISNKLPGLDKVIGVFDSDVSNEVLIKVIDKSTSSGIPQEYSGDSDNGSCSGSSGGSSGSGKW